MQIIIYGATDIGYMIAAHLSHDHDITLIDDQERLPDKFSALDISYVSGSGSSIATLEQASHSKAALFIACTTVDEANIVACWTAKKITDIETVCIVSKKEVYKTLNSPIQREYQTKYDIDKIIWPEQLLTQDIFRIILVPGAIDVEYFDDGNATLFEYRLKEESALCNCRVMDYDFPKDTLIVGITRDEELFIPNGQTTILPGDKVILMGKSLDLSQLAIQIHNRKKQIKTAAIIGGGNVGYTLASQLEHSKIRVKLIEHNKTRCDFLADNLHSSLVLQGDGTDLQLLEDENIGDHDVVICVTDNDEKNLLCSLLVKQLGGKRIITRTGKSHNAELFERVGVDVVVSPHQSTLKELLNIIESKGVNILALVGSGRAEVLHVKVDTDFPVTKVTDLNLPESAIMALVKRGTDIIIPKGQTEIRGGDDIAVFTTVENLEPIKSVFVS